MVLYLDGRVFSSMGFSEAYRWYLEGETGANKQK